MGSMLLVETNLVHVDVYSFYHFIQYCLIMHSLTAIAIRNCRPLGQSPHAIDVDSAVNAASSSYKVQHRSRGQLL